MAAITQVKAYGGTSATTPLVEMMIPRRAPKETDVQIDILYSGICHSDLHTVRSEWGPAIYPCVPGHEILGRATAVGSKVTKYKVGDLVAVGCLVGSDHTCPHCAKNLEQFCAKAVFTYNTPDPDMPGKPTYGGYSTMVVVDESFVVKVPENLNPAAAAPLTCAGITTYSPLRHWNVGPGKKVGIAGLGGLGHMGVKFAVAMGAHVTVLTTSTSKVADAKRLGAHDVILTTDAEEMKKRVGSFDFILDTISADHDIISLVNLLCVDGNITLVGAPPKPLPLAAFPLIMGRRSISGSLIGGLAETQEMLDFCGKHNITADIEMIPIQKINEAYERLVKADVKYRFVIDMASLKN